MACCFRVRVFVCLCPCSFLCVVCDGLCGVVWFVCFFLCGVCVCMCLFFVLKKRVLFVIDCVMLCDVVWAAFFSKRLNACVCSRCLCVLPCDLMCGVVWSVLL